MVNALTKEVAKRVADIISDNGYNVKIVESQELNGTPRISLVCNRGADSHVSPTVHLTDKEAYKATAHNLKDGIADIAAKFLDQLSHAKQTGADISAMFASLTDIMASRDRLLANVTMMLVNAQANKNSGLVMVPTAGDLAYIFTVSLPNGSGHVKIRPEHCATHGISSAELFNAARVNTEISKPAKIGTIDEFIPIPRDLSEGPNIYVVTTTDKNVGAAAITYPSVIKELTDKLGNDFIVIPSSIHEVLCIKESAGEQIELIQIIASVNKDVVAPNERLSDHPYTMSNGVLVSA